VSTSLKRAFDVVGAAVGLALAAPLLGAAALLVRACDGGPVLFRQPRVGRARRPFTIVKLRTMRDGRATRVGVVLRELGVDELPQLWNVLRGDMSLVGPRPLTDDDVHRLGWRAAAFDARWSVRPGITGLAQLVPTRVCDGRATWLLDRAYVRRAGPALDAWILGLSALVPVVGKRRLRAFARGVPRGIA
jgi:lipopolysaccharide/colanic/teichoic acid biosynthesis glycosyltransferase